jgi:hypothetical protein
MAGGGHGEISTISAFHGCAGPPQPILSRDVLRRIAADDDSWQSMVPPEVAELIKRRAFFGYVKPGRS